jgi:hypothetical protein
MARLSPSISSYNNQSITETATVEQGEQFSPSLQSIQLKDKIESIATGLEDYFVRLLKKQSSQNAETISDYILAMNTEVNPSIHHRTSQIRTLSYL